MAGKSKGSQQIARVYFGVQDLALLAIGICSVISSIVESKGVAVDWGSTNTLEGLKPSSAYIRRKA